MEDPLVPAKMSGVIQDVQEHGQVAVSLRNPRYRQASRPGATPHARRCMYVSIVRISRDY